ncbi:MAG: D-glycero-beta-D-manno-heptose-7-phosphate kinase [Candidatus Omnitrophica bacterium 4484_70.1]|nr:MAG: D-glycero-beta-D-manno-heptose-7-phosphate kinase [Candidatus Omnitrophica bacterium 4484_70.1]
MKREEWGKIIKRFSRASILVIGDVILDHYILGSVERISPEAPVPVVRVGREKFLGGGAVNVGFNLAGLGAKVYLCGVIGNDHFGKVLLSLIKEKGIESNLVFKDKNRPTTLKTRVIAQHQQVTRIDWESNDFLSLTLNRKIVKRVKENIDKFDAVIIEDYGKGVINPHLVKEIVSLCKKKNKIITVDPKEDHFDYYTNVTALTPNLKEACVAANMRIRKESEIELLGEVLKERLHPQGLLITLGEKGMRLFVDNTSYHIPSTALEVFDVTGAGDTVIAVFTLGLTCGASFLQSAILANLSAAVVVGKLGAATITKEELLSRIDLANSKNFFKEVS